MLNESEYQEETLFLAAEDCPPDDFNKFHKFARYENNIINSLMAHGPVLLRGGRGSGKSALMMEAYNRIKGSEHPIFAVYLSLRVFPLLKSKGEEFQKCFCELLSQRIINDLNETALDNDFCSASNPTELQREIVELSKKTRKRVVLLLDDAAHIGRNIDLTDFFDMFRILSGSVASCKASIYPGVTKFGDRFDVYNDANVIDISREERHPNFGQFFLEVLERRSPELLAPDRLSKEIGKLDLARFLGRVVVGNVRAFVIACNELKNKEKININTLNECLHHLASNYYWPLLDEVEPKLGIYESFIEPTRILAEKIFKRVAKEETVSVLIHRDLVRDLAKLFEILEYAGFISRREASLAMKSGGRGSHFVLNLCNLLEVMPGSRLTSELFLSWPSQPPKPDQIQRSNSFLKIELPKLPEQKEQKELKVLKMPIEKLVKSNAYPYGLTEAKIKVLKKAKIITVGDLAEVSNEKLYSLRGIRDKYVARIRSVVGQAIWM